MADTISGRKREILDRMSLVGIEKLWPGEQFHSPRISASESFKCPSCGKIHQTVSFVKCEYCGFGRKTPELIMIAGSAVFHVIKPELLGSFIPSDKHGYLLPPKPPESRKVK